MNLIGLSVTIIDLAMYILEFLSKQFFKYDPLSLSVISDTLLVSSITEFGLAFVDDNNKILFNYKSVASPIQYEKPRPYKRGAFYYAVKNNVPIIPTFITFTDLGKVDKNGNPRKKFHYHIMPAIYAPEGLQRKEKEEYLRNAAFEACKNKYEEFYGKKLTYTCDEGKE